MLSAIELTNFRAHAHTTVPLTRFTLLVGENATGKTSVLEAVHLIGRWLDPSNREETFAGRWAPEFLRRQGVNGPAEMAVTGAAHDPWRFAIRFPLGSKLYDTEYTWSRGGAEKQGKLGELNSPPHLAAIHEASTSLTPAPRLLSLDPRAISQPAASDDLVPVLEPDGSGLATVLKNLKVTDDEAYRRLVDAARTVVPSLSDLRFQRTRLTDRSPRVMTVEGQRVLVPDSREYIADELLLKFADTDWLPAHAASEGTLLTLAILSLLIAPPAPRVLLLEDLDRALHPRAQADLITALRGALERQPDTQIIATTHSPYLADHFEPDSVVVLGRTDGGPVVARRLSDHPDRRLREALTTGEFLTASGPGWFWR
jgi:predicted ATPase